jgi:cysteine desulfurase / selenocysteine lyase
VSTEQIDALIDSKTRAVVVSHVSYLNGYRHDLRKIADIIHNRGGYLIVDGSQSIGGIRVNIKDEQVDVMAGIPYKWLTGPNGLGFFYIREELIPLIAPDRLGWSSFDGFESLETFESKPSPDTAKRYEYGTLSFEGIYALDAALDYFNQIGIEHIEQRNLRLIDLARSRLCEKGYKLLTPLHNQSPILSFFTDDEQAFARQMKAKGFYVTAGRRAEGYIRISPHFYNTEEEINTFVHALPDL